MPKIGRNHASIQISILYATPSPEYFEMELIHMVDGDITDILRSFEKVKFKLQ